MSAVVGAIDRIKDVALHLEDCYGQSVDKKGVKEIDFLAQLASDTGCSVEEIKLYVHGKIEDLVCDLVQSTKEIVAICKQDSSASDRSEIVEFLVDVYQKSASFYDNYGHLIYPDCSSRFLDSLEALEPILESLANEFDPNVRIAKASLSDDPDYNLQQLILAVDV